MLRPSKTKLNNGRAVLWSLNCPSKMGPRIQAEKTKTQKNDNTTIDHTQRFFLQKEEFLEKKIKKYCLYFGLELLAFLWPKTSKDHGATKHYKTRGFVVFFVVLSFVRLSQTRTTTIKTKTSNDDKTTTMGPQNQADPKNKKHQKNDDTKPTN